MSIRGHRSWQASWASGDRGYQELCGAELEATCRKRPGGCHVLCGKGNLLHLNLKKNPNPDILLFSGGLASIFFSSVCHWHRQLAEGEHWDPCQISSFCTVWSGRGKILQLPRPLLQLCWCRRAVWPNWSHHRWGQARSGNCIFAHMHHSGSKVTFLEGGVENVNCSGRQISHLLLAKSSRPETRTHQLLCPGKHPETPKSWWDTTLRVVWWAATCGSHVTTSPLRVPGNITLYFGFKQRVNTEVCVWMSAL